MKKGFRFPMHCIAPVFAMGLCVCLTAHGSAAAPSENADGFFESILREHPGQVAEVPPGEYRITRAIELNRDGVGLRGAARIIMATPTEPIIMAGGRKNLWLDSLTLERETDDVENVEAIHFMQCEDVRLTNLRVLNNRSRQYAIHIERCRNSRVVGCEVLNYKQICPNVRATHTFNCIDGHGIVFNRSLNNQADGNRIIERRLFPDQKTKTAHQLGVVTAGLCPVDGMEDYFPAWHQGAGIGSFRGACSIITNNYIENACQGFDFQTDYSVLANNVVQYAQTGIKCMHFTENVVIANNNVSYADLWGLVMAPGPAAQPARQYTKGPKSTAEYQELMEKSGMDPERAELTVGNIITGNVFSHFGEGYEYYNWVPVLDIDAGFHSVIDLWGQWENQKKGAGYEFEPDSCMKSVLLQGNIIYHSGQDGVLEEGKTVYPPPKYKYAIFQATGQYAPQQVFLSGNILHEGYEGVRNVRLKKQEKLLNLVVKHSQRRER